jgi:hypothetical protein
VAIVAARARLAPGRPVSAAPRDRADRRKPTDGRPDEWLQWLHAEHYPALLATPGAAGAWTFGSGAGWSHLPRGWRTEHQYISVIYLDQDPLTTIDVLAPLIEERWRSTAVRSMISWEAWP